MSEQQEEAGAAVRTVIEAQEAERHRICLDLHDVVAQTLTQALLRLQAIEAMPDVKLSGTGSQIAQAVGLIRQAEREVRDLIYRLRPASLDAVGLVKTLEADMESLGREQGLKIEFETNVTFLPGTMELALYRIAHEALNNVVQHAKAHRVVLRLFVDEGRVRMSVHDEGVGFDPAEIPKPGRGRDHGIGLLSMRARADLLRGSLALSSAPGGGTTVEVDVPLRAPRTRADDRSRGGRQRGPG